MRAVEDDRVYLGSLGVLVAILLRCCTMLHPYSGQGRPPMYGDYEAQRHWMEITLNLPADEWYRNSTQNDLQYWGLDYPPLTAYHSYVCGLVASVINPKYVELGESRGYESEEHKRFMRYTVLWADLLVYVPAIILFFMVTSKEDGNKEIPLFLRIFLALIYPGLVLIDHGHFQYNCVSLGLTIFAVTCIFRERHVLASILFCLALNYKQMELYHSVPFFLHLLSACAPKPGQSVTVGVKKLCKISATVVVSFVCVWLPFLFDRDDLFRVLHRLFPVARGVFEDKVANVWCALNVYFKFKTNFEDHQMFRLCLLTTLGAILPFSCDLCLRPDVRKFVPSLINSSLAFFLFSFQVHEKSILLAAVPAVLYLHVEPFACFWFLIVSTFSLLPLMVKDELVVAFIALVTFYSVSFHLVLSRTGRFDDLMGKFKCLRASKRNIRGLYDLVPCFGFVTSMVGCFVLILSYLVLQPPEKYPDLYPLLISVYSCVHFLAFFVYFNAVQLKTPRTRDTRRLKID